MRMCVEEIRHRGVEARAMGKCVWKLAFKCTFDFSFAEFDYFETTRRILCIDTLHKKGGDYVYKKIVTNDV